MRISDPKLFNGQTLATKQQISAWLAGIDNTGFGTLSIPSANISGLSELATAVSNNTTNISTNATNISTISGALGTINSASETTAFGKILALQSAIKDLTGQEGDGNVLSLKDINDRLTTEITERAAADEYISGIVDTKADQATLVAVSGELKTAIDLKAAQADLVTVSGKVNENATAISTLTTDYKAADAYISGVVNELSDWQTGFVDKTATIEGTGLAEVITGDLDSDSGVQTFTVNVPSAAAFYNHDIQLSGVAATEGYASSYKLMVDGVAKGDTINIPKDQYLSGVTYIPSSNTLKFEWKLADNTITTTDVQITDLIDTISGGNGISTTGNTVSVKIKDDDKYITADASGLQTKGIDGAIDAAVSGANAKLAGITDTVSAYVTDAISGKANTDDVTDINTRLTTAENTITTLTGGVEVSGSVKYEAADAATKAVSGANAKLEGIETVSGAIEAAKTAVISEVKLVEQTLTFDDGKATVTTAGRVLQVFDSTGVCWPDIKYSEAGIATIDIGTDAVSTTGYSAVIVKKTNIA